MKKKDREYHEARALLLGMEYSALTHTYIKHDKSRGLRRIDADTLEVVSGQEAEKRIDDATS